MLSLHHEIATTLLVKNKVMKTYIAFRKEDNGFKMVAIEANSSIEAYNSLKSMGFKLNKSSIKISAISIDYVSCEKIQ